MEATEAGEEEEGARGVEAKTDTLISGRWHWRAPKWGQALRAGTFERSPMEVAGATASTSTASERASELTAEGLFRGP